MRATYWDPRKEATVSLDVQAIDDVIRMLDIVAQVSSTRGRPALELVHEDGSTLSIASDGERAFLVWIDVLGNTYHSRGGSDAGDLVFDYFGSWSEAPRESLVAIADAMQAARAFLEAGSPLTDAVRFEQES